MGGKHATLLSTEERGKGKGVFDVGLLLCFHAGTGMEFCFTDVQSTEIGKYRAVDISKLEVVYVFEYGCHEIAFDLCLDFQGVRSRWYSRSRPFSPC